MRGHLRKRGNKWSFVIDAGTNPDGSRKQKWYSGYDTKVEAEKALTEVLSKLNKGIYVDSKNLTVEEYLNLWISEYAETNVKPKTYRSYKDTVEKYLIPNLGRKKLEKLTPVEIQSYLNIKIKEGELSNTTILYHYKVLKQSLNQAIKWQLLNYNPCNAVDPPKKSKKEMKVLDEFEIELLLDHVKKEKIYLPVLLALTTGMRRGEICGLKWSDVDFINNVIYVSKALQMIEGTLTLVEPKTQKSNRSVAVPENVMEVLKAERKKQIEYRMILGETYKNNNFVCSWDDGRPINPDYISKTFPKIRRKLGLEVRFHDLRHTHATMLLKQNIHPKVVQERLGHSSIGITMDTYSHVSPDMQKEAAKKIGNIIK